MLMRAILSPKTWWLYRTWDRSGPYLHFTVIEGQKQQGNAWMIIDFQNSIIWTMDPLFYFLEFQTIKRRPCMCFNWVYTNRTDNGGPENDAHEVLPISFFTQFSNPPRAIISWTLGGSSPTLTLHFGPLGPSCTETVLLRTSHSRVQPVRRVNCLD